MGSKSFIGIFQLLLVMLGFLKCEMVKNCVVVCLLHAYLNTSGDSSTKSIPLSGSHEVEQI